MSRLARLALFLAAVSCAPSPAAHTTTDGEQPRTSQRQVTSPETRVGRPFDARVVIVGDGDTLELIPSGESQPIRIRLEGIDAPELNEPFGREATTYTRRLLYQQQVRVEGRDVDGYGRLVARVLVGGRDASRALLEAGLACHFTRFANDPVLAAAERQARSTNLGFWSPTAEKPRCTGLATTASPDPRAKGGTSPGGTSTNTGRPSPSSGRTDSAAAFRGNVNSRLYHAASCPNANCRNCTRVFSTEAEARAAGFTPAGDCLRP